MKTALVILLFCFSLGLQAQQVRDFALTDLKNTVQRYEDVKGASLTVIDFWASWCKPCLKSMPTIEKLHLANKDRGVKFIGINCDGPRSISKVQPLTKMLKVTYLVLTDINNTVMNDLEVTALPTLLIVDKNNRIVYRHEGFSKGDELEIQHKIDEYLKTQP